VLLGYVVLFGTVVPFGLILLGLRTIDATRAGLLGVTEPVLAGLIAWPVLGEAWSVPQLAGGALVLAGIVGAEVANARARA
jgi:drug/metabolite transporter (DMT)-like permease